MAITVDWPNKIINVPRNDLILIQSVPTEIREIDMNSLRLILKDLEDDEEGMPWVDTHRHVAPINVGGVTLARVVEIINGYTVTFEDGQYAVNLKGANTNLADVTNVNQVSVRSSNSAGLQDLSTLLANAYSDTVVVDPLLGQPGTDIPIGTRATPVSNLADALVIAGKIGVNRITMRRSMTIADHDFSQGFEFVGDNAVVVTATLASSANLTNCTFKNLTITGILDGNTVIRECSVYNLTYFDGFLWQCALSGYITLMPGSQASIAECFSNVAGGGPGQTPVMDMGGSGSLALRSYVGGLEIRNYDGSNGAAVSIDIESGRLIVHNTVTAGDIYVRGLAIVEDNSTGTAVVHDQTVIKNIQSAGYANGSIWVDTENGHAGAEPFTNGLADHPVDNWSDALTLSALLGIRRFQMALDTTITLSGDSSELELIGRHWYLNLNGQTVNDLYVEGASVAGVGVVTDDGPHFRDCEIGVRGPITVGESTFNNCGFSQLTMTTGAYGIIDGYSMIPGQSAPVFDFGGGVGTIDAFFRRWSGGAVLNNLASGDTVSLDAVSGGNATLNGADAVVSVRGMIRVVNNLTGTPTVTETQALNTTKLAGASDLAAVKAKTDQLDFVGGDVKATLDGEAVGVDLSGLNDLSAAEVRAEVDAGLAAYDAATAADLAAAVDPLATTAELTAAVDPLSTTSELEAAVAPLATAAGLAAAVDPLATTAELTAAVAPLATAAGLAAAVDPLVTTSELAAAVAPLATSAQISALNNLSAGQVWAAAERTLTDKVGYTLTSDERAAIAAAVEAAILNEADGRAVIAAIAAAIDDVVDEDALVAAIRADLERDGGALDVIHDNQAVINDGVKKASKSIPHSTNVV